MGEDAEMDEQPYQEAVEAPEAVVAEQMGTFVTWGRLVCAFGGLQRKIPSSRHSLSLSLSSLLLTRALLLLFSSQNMQRTTDIVDANDRGDEDEGGKPMTGTYKVRSLCFLGTQASEEFKPLAQRETPERLTSQPHTNHKKTVAHRELPRYHGQGLLGEVRDRHAHLVSHRSRNASSSGRLVSSRLSSHRRRLSRARVQRDPLSLSRSETTNHQTQS
jgi:hypothetical protein